MSFPIDKIVKTLRHLIVLFIQADFIALEKLSNSIRLSAKEMEIAISEYGEILVIPSDEVFENIDVIEIEGTSPKAWSIRFDFWTEKEGLSDLTLELTMIASDEELFKVEIDNIHVM